MKFLTITPLIVTAGAVFADELKVAWSQYGTPIQVSDISSGDASAKNTKLDREVEAFRAKHEARNAVLINNSEGRALKKGGQLAEPDGGGRLVTPTPVITISEAMVADPVVKLYTSIARLPECANTIRILYTESEDRSEASLLGYTIEKPDGVYTKLVKYDGKTPWLEWITKSFQNDDAEQNGAGQPATASELKSEGKEKLKPESEGRSQ